MIGTFEPFQKIPRLNRECFISEKIDGTNATVYVIHTPEGATVHAASRNKLITIDDDNHGFAKWVKEHEEELKQLGPGIHRGEWFGPGVNRRSYGLKQKQFALFNIGRWNSDNPPPKCCVVVPLLYKGIFSTEKCNELLDDLRKNGIRLDANTKAEGIVVYHVAGDLYFKATCENDESHKGQSE